MGYRTILVKDNVYYLLLKLKVKRKQTFNDLILDAIQMLPEFKDILNEVEVKSNA
jgi:predicted CopG family antitoxin